MLKKLITIFLFTFLFSQDEQSITNLTVGQLTDGSGLIAVNYDLIDNAEIFASFNVEIQVSIDDGPFQTFSGDQVSGDVGENVIPGVGRVIYIQAPEDTYSTNVLVKIIATGYVVTSELPFTMISISSTEGVSSYQGESINYSYEIMQNELTNAELVTFLETYDFTLNENGEPVYNCSDYTDYFNTGHNGNENQIQCNDPTALNNLSDVDCVYSNQVGCTDPYAFNFSPEATYYDCSCYTTSNTYSEYDEASQNCLWSNLGMDDQPGGSFIYIDINNDGMYDLMTQNGSRIIFQGCNDPNAANFPTEIADFMIENNIESDCFDIEYDGSCEESCNEDYLGNDLGNDENLNTGSVNIEDFYTQNISFEGSSFVIQSGAGTKPAIFNYENCVDGVIVGLMLDYYGLRIPSGSEWTKSARLDNTRCWPWMESDCEAEATSYCNSIYECMTDEEFDNCEESANDLFLECQMACNDSNSTEPTNCEQYFNEDSCNNIEGCDWSGQYDSCIDSCSGCMDMNLDLCGGSPCGSPNCPCCDVCTQNPDMEGMMECVNECSSIYGNGYEYCNGDEVNECKWCLESYQDCDGTDLGNFTNFLDISDYDDDDGDGIWTSNYDQFGFYAHIFSNKFYFPFSNEFDCDGGDCVTIDISDIAQYPNGISPFGLYDMIGNAPEVVKHDNNLWLVGLQPNQDYISSFCENGGTMFDENTGNGHATGLSIGVGPYFNLYGLRLSRTAQ